MHMQHSVDPREALELPSFRSLYLLTATIGVLIAADLVFRWLGWTTLQRPLGYDLALIAALIGGARIVYGALVGIMEGNIGADIALAIAMLAALLLREYWVAAEVAFIAMVGESLEAVTFKRAHRELRKILELAPKTARVLRDGAEVELPIEQVEPGDVVIVRPGERVPVDGVVIDGRTTVDQSALTGESLPVDVGEGDNVYAGSLNQYGAVRVRTERVREETTLGQVIKLVAQAQMRKAPIERLADRYARLFLPAVLTAAVLTLIYTNWGAPSWKNLNWMPTLAVLVVACPCGLILATPAAAMAAMAWMARHGVIMKASEALERLATVRYLAFDKTGTLTQAKLQLGRIVPLDNVTETQLLAWAAAVESLSEHHIAKLIVSEAKRRDLPLAEVTEFRVHPGAGIEGLVPGTGRVVIGNQRLMDELGVVVTEAAEAECRTLEQQGMSPLMIAVEGRVVGLVGVEDRVRPEAADIIHELKHLGIREIVLLTGDRRHVAARVAQQVGVDHFEAEMLPADKARWIERWRKSVRQQARERLKLLRIRRSLPGVGMVGDGINDAPALAIADAGLALGGVGTDIAAEAGDLVLMGEPLKPLPELIRFSRAVLRVIRQNILIFAFGLNTGAILLSAEEVLGPIGAAITHQIGSFLVLCNAVRLLWFEKWERSALGRAERAAARWVMRLADFVTPAVGWLWRQRRRLATAGVAAAAVAYAASGLVQIGPDEIGAVRRFGRFQTVLPPGLHWRLPRPFEQIDRVPVARVHAVEIGFRRRSEPRQREPLPIEWDSPHREGILERVEDESLVFTGDNRLLELNATVQYRVAVGDPARLTPEELKDVVADYLYRVRYVEDTVRVVAEEVLRELTATQSFNAVLTRGRHAIELAAAQRIQKRLGDYGLPIEVVAVTLQDVHPPLEVVDAFRELARAFKERERLEIEAEAYRVQRLISSAGQKVSEQLVTATTKGDPVEELWHILREQLQGTARRMLNRAEAEAAVTVARAEAEATLFRARLKGHRVAPLVSATRLYHQTLAAALEGRETVIVDQSGKGRRQLWLTDTDALSRLGQLLQETIQQLAVPAPPPPEE